MRELNIDPESNIDIEILKAEVTQLTVKDEVTEIEASRLIGKIDQQIEEIESSEKLVRDAYEERLNELRRIKKILEGLKSQVKADITAYKEIARMKISEMREDLKNGKIERKELFLTEGGKIVSESALSIRTDNGLSSVRKHIIIDVTDISKVPAHYLRVDKDLIRKDLRKGVTPESITGVIISEKPVIQYRSKKLSA